LARFSQPVHHVLGDFSGALHFAGFAVYFSFGFHAAHHAAGAVDGAVEGVFGGLVLNAFQDYGGFAHGAADEAFLAGKCRSCSFADDPIVLTIVRLAPCEIVMVVNFLENGSAENAGNFFAHPIAPGVGVFSGQGHAL
jgi:hypothetical protein